MNRVIRFLPTAMGVLGGVLLAGVLVAILGESPWTVLQVLVKGSFGSETAVGYSLFYATPLILTGLAVWWALAGGLFNIGAEGQMTVGGIAMALVGIYMPGLPPLVAWPLSLLVGFSAGAFWGGLVAWFKIHRGTHEVLTSILLNFVSYGVAGFFILNVARNPEVQTPETLPIGAGFQLPALSISSPLNLAFVFALLAALLAEVFMHRSIFGLRTRWTGGAPEFAKRTGISTDRQTVLAFLISGGLAGLAGASMILGYTFKAREGFAGGAGFIGIAVALLGGRRAWGVILAAILFGALQKGALDLDLDTETISRDLAIVIQALIVMAVAGRPLFESLLSRISTRFFGVDRWNS